LSFAFFARAIKRLTRETERPSALAMALAVRPLSVCARNRASSREAQALNHWTRPRVVPRRALGISRAAVCHVMLCFRLGCRGKR
jgi:hypothetical protein